MAGRIAPISLPRLLSGAEILDTFDLPLAADEHAALERSAEILIEETSQQA